MPKHAKAWQSMAVSVGTLKEDSETFKACDLLVMWTFYSALLID
jgi:hypothetical protein